MKLLTCQSLSIQPTIALPPLWRHVRKQSKATEAWNGIRKPYANESKVTDLLAITHAPIRAPTTMNPALGRLPNRITLYCSTQEPRNANLALMGTDVACVKWVHYITPPCLGSQPYPCNPPCGQLLRWHGRRRGD